MFGITGSLWNDCVVTMFFAFLGVMVVVKKIAANAAVQGVVKQQATGLAVNTLARIFGS